MRKFTYAAVALAALTLMGSSAAFAAKPDAWITSKAKIALFTTEGVSATAVNVDTVDGRVTLHGKVASDAEKKKAGDAVAKIEGATEVRNLLQVVPPSKEEKVEASDEQITTQVEERVPEGSRPRRQRHQGPVGQQGRRPARGRDAVDDDPSPRDHYRRGGPGRAAGSRPR